MLHAKFQDHGTSGSGEEDFLRFLPYIAEAQGKIDTHTGTGLSSIPLAYPKSLWLR